MNSDERSLSAPSKQTRPFSFAERFVRGTILARMWSSANTFIGLITSFLTITALSVYEFGLYQLVLAAIALADTFSVNFFDEVVSNDISRELGDGNRRIAKRLFNELAVVKIGLAALLALAFFVGADLVAKLYDKDIGFYIRIASALILVRAARSAADLFLRSVVSLRALGASAVEEAAKLSFVAVLFFFSALTIGGVLAAAVFGAVASLVYVSIPFRREYGAFFSSTIPAAGFLLRKTAARYGPWVLMRSAVKKIAKPVQPWLIVTFLGAEAVALYALAANLVTMVKDFFPAASSSLLAWETNDYGRLKYIFSRGMKYSLFYGITLAAVALFFVPWIIGALFPKYLPAMPLFYVFLVSVPFHGIQTLEMAILTALREQKVLAMRLFAEILMNFGLFIVLVHWFGLLAAGFGIVVPALWRSWFLYRQIIKNYPELRPGIGTFFSFDQEDRLIAGRALSEARLFVKKCFSGRGAPNA